MTKGNLALGFTALPAGTVGAFIRLKMKTKQTALTAQPLSVAERKARLAASVASGKVSAKAAKLIDFREPTERERAFAQTLAGKAQTWLARKKRAVA